MFEYSSSKRDKWIRSEKSSKTLKSRSHRYNRSRLDRRGDKSRPWRKTQRERSHSCRDTEDKEQMRKYRSSKRKLESRKQSKRKYHSHRKRTTRENSDDDDNDEGRNGRRSNERAGEQRAEQSSLYWQMKALAPLSSTNPIAAAQESSRDDDGGHRKKSKKQRSRHKKKPLCKPCRREMRRSVKWNLAQILSNLLNKEEKRTGRKHCLCEKCLGVKGGQSKDCRFAKFVEVEDEDKANCARHSTTLSKYLTVK
uniref:Uncharacterized protein n=1 Tax=Romanomermis culicivorax TaxID=13658 RepID=A0A915IRC9_ROMCU